MNERAKILIILVLAALLFSGVGKAQDSEENRSELVTRGIALYQQGKVEEALAVLQEAVAANPDDADALNAIGVIYSMEGDVDKAIEYFDRATDKREGFFKAIYNKFNMLAENGKAEEAKLYLESVVEKYPDHAATQINLGLISFQRGELEKAIGYFDKAVELNPKDYDSLFKKGGALVLLKRYEEALVCFNRVTELTSDPMKAKTEISFINDILEKKRNGYIRVRQILVRDASLATKLKGRLDDGADFSELARMYSSDTSAKYGGDLGFVKKGDLIAFIENAIFGLEVGQVSVIVRSPRGFHLFMREE